MSNILAAKQFAGDLVAEITPNIDREGVDCHVYKGDYQASLGLLEAEGVLWWNGSGNKPDLIIKEETVSAISQWAESHGY